MNPVVTFGLDAYRGWGQIEGTPGRPEAAPVATPILKLIGDGSWIGTAEQLLYQVEAMVPDSVRRSPEWPKTPRGMRSALTRLNPNLRPLGFEVTFGHDGTRERTRLITITRRVPSAPSDGTGVTDR